MLTLASTAHILGIIYWYFWFLEAELEFSQLSGFC